MDNLIPFVVAENVLLSDIIPATRRLAGLLGLSLSEQQVKVLFASHGFAYGALQEEAVRHIVNRLSQIYAFTPQGFRLDAETLLPEAIRLDWNREPNFYYEPCLRRECRYLVPQPIKEDCDLLTLLAPLHRWMNIQNQLPHSRPLGVGLLLATLSRLAFADRTIRYHFDELIFTLTTSTAEMLAENTYNHLNKIIEVEVANA